MKIFLFIISFVLLFSSCEKKQKLRAKKESRQQAINGCKNSQFVGEVLSKENTLNLFRCLGWHLELSSLYDEIENFNESQWNTFVSPLNEIFFKESNYEMRGKLFNFFYKLEKDGSLDQLSTFLSKVDFKGLSDLTSVVIRCKKQGECTEHDLEVSRSLIPEEDSYNNLILLLDYFKKSLSSNDEKKIIKDLQTLLLDRKMDFFIYDLIKNDGHILKDDKFKRLVLKPVKDMLFKDETGRSILKDYASNFETKEKFSSYLNSYLIPKSLSVIPTVNVVSKFNGALPCEMGTDSDLVSFDLDYRLKNFFNNTLGGKRLLGPSLIEQSAFVVLAGELCGNLKSLKTNISQFSFFEETPKKIIVKTSLGLKQFNDDLNSLFIDNNSYLAFKLLYDTLLSHVDEGHRFKDLFYIMNHSDTDLSVAFVRYIHKTYLDELTSLENLIYTSELDTFFLLNQFVSKLESNDDLLELVGEISERIDFKNISFARSILAEALGNINSPIEAINNVVSVMDLTRDLPPIVEDKWFSKVGTLKSLIAFFSRTSKMLENENVKNDVSRLASSRYLIRAIKLLSLGGSKDGVTTDEIIKQIEETRPNLNSKSVFVLQNYLDENESSCLTELSQAESTLSSLMQGLPGDCRNLERPGDLIYVFSELNVLHEKLTEYSEETNSNIDTLLGKSFMGNPSLVGDGILLLNTLYNNFENTEGKSDEVVTQEFLDSFINKATNVELVSAVDSLVEMMTDYFDADPVKQVGHRNYFLKNYLSELDLNGEKVRNYILEFNGHLNDFLWDYDYLEEEEINEYKACDEYFTFWIGHDQCPEGKIVSKHLTNLSYLLLRTNERNRPSALASLLKLALPGEGILIPYEAENQRKVVFGVEEILKMAVNVNDPAVTVDGRRVNNQVVDFWVLNKRRRKEKVKYLMTTSQRMETTVREVQFDLNYLGVSYMNTVARGENYESTVKDNFKLLKRCALYLRYCMRFFSKREHVMVRNGIATYPALWDLESYWGHGESMQGLVTALVESSSKAAAKADKVKYRGFRIPHVPKDKDLKKHNGQIFTQLSMLSVFSNLGRVLETRFGGFDKFSEYLKTTEFKVFSAYFLKNLSFDSLHGGVHSVIKKFIEYTDDTNRSIIERTSKWYALRDKRQSIHLQNILADLVMISPFVGIDTEQFYTPEIYVNPKYKKNSLMFFVNMADDLMDVWKYLYDSLDVEKQESLLRKVSFVTSFIKKGLYSPSIDKSLFFYELLNESIYFMDKYMYGFVFDQIRGIDFLKLGFYDQKFPVSFNNFTNKTIDYLDQFEVEDNIDFSDKINSLLKEDEQKSLTHMIDNVLYFVDQGINELDSKNVEGEYLNKNYNFYEHFIRFLSQKDANDRSNINKFAIWLSDPKNSSAITNVMKNVLGSIKPAM